MKDFFKILNGEMLVALAVVAFPWFWGITDMIGRTFFKFMFWLLGGVWLEWIDRRKASEWVI
jgi:hypothetical protein